MGFFEELPLTARVALYQFIEYQRRQAEAQERISTALERIADAAEADAVEERGGEADRDGEEDRDREGQDV